MADLPTGEGLVRAMKERTEKSSSKSLQFVESLIPRRVLYAPWHTVLDGVDGQATIVYVLNFRRSDFGREKATHWKHLLPGPLKLVQTLANIACYYAGLKPTVLMGEPSKDSSAFLLSETLTNVREEAIGLRLYLCTFKPLSHRVLEQMRIAATLAHDKAIGITPAVRKVLSEAGLKVLLFPPINLILLQQKKKQPQKKKKKQGAGHVLDDEAMEVDEEEAEEEEEEGGQKRRRDEIDDLVEDIGAAERAQGARAAKRARIDQESSAEEMLEEMFLEKAHDRDGTWFSNGPLVAGLFPHVQESVYVGARFEMLPKKIAKEIWGKQGKQWHPAYNYLRLESLETMLESVAAYYEGTDSELSNAILALGRNKNDETMSKVLGTAFSMAHALIYRLPTEVDPKFCDPRHYYPDDMDIAQVDWPHRTRATIEEIRDVARWMDDWQTPFPQAFPAPDLCRVLDRQIMLPELLVDRPLAFPLDRKVQPALLATDTEALVRDNAPLFARLMVEVGSYEGELSDQMRQTVDTEIVTAYLGDASRVAAYQQLREEEHEQAIQRRIQQEILNPLRIVTYVKRRQQSILRTISDAYQRLASGRYPHLLSPESSVVLPGQSAEARKHADRQVLIVAPDTGDEHGMLGLQDIETFRARLQEQHPEQNWNIPITDAVGDEADAQVGPDGEKTRSPLVENAIKLKSQAGTSAQIPDSILAQSDLFCKQVLNRAERTAMARRWEAEGIPQEQRQKELTEIMDRQGRETIQLFLKTDNEAEALLRIRASALQHWEKEDSCMGPLQPNVNEKSFHACMTWTRGNLRAAGAVRASTEYPVMAAFVNAKDALRMPEFGQGQLHTNMLIGGSHSAGKSYTLSMTITFHLPESVERMARFSPQAFFNGKNNSYKLYVQDEADQDALKDPSNPGARGHNKSDNSGSAQHASFLKAMLTDMVVGIVVLERDSKTGERKATRYMSLTSNSFFFAGNFDILGQVSAPMLSRFIYFEYYLNTQTKSGQENSMVGRPHSIESEKDLVRLTNHFHSLHAMHLWIEVLLTADVVPSGVIHDTSTLLLENIFHRLKTEYYFSSQKLTPRNQHFVAITARGLCIYHAAWCLLFTEAGHFYMTKNKRKPYDWETLRDFIIPRLVVTSEHILFALSLYAPQFRSPFENDTMMVIADEVGVATPNRQTGLQTMESDLIGDQLLQIELGLRRTPAHNPDEQAPIRPVAPAPHHPLMRPIPSIPGPVDQLVYDDRYLTLTAENEHRILLLIADKIEAIQGKKVRPDAIHNLITDMVNNTIPSYYYRRDPKTRSLEVIADSNGVERQDNIPVMVRKHIPGEMGKKKLQIGISVTYLMKVHNFAIAVGDEKRILDAINVELLRPAELKLIQNRIKLAPIKRLGLEEINETMLTKAFAEAWSQCDVFTDPMCRAMRAALENETFRLTKPRDTMQRNALQLDDSMEQVKESYLLIFPPKSFVLLAQVKDRTHKLRIDLSRFFGLLDVRRDQHARGLVFNNTHRATSTSLPQLAASLGYRGRSASTFQSAFLNFVQTGGLRIDMDPDATDSINRMQKLGSPKNPLMDQLAKLARCDANVPWSYGPNFDRIYNFLYKQRADLERPTLPPPPLDGGFDPARCIDRVYRYPSEDILDEATKSLAIIKENLVGTYELIKPLSRVLLTEQRTAVPNIEIPRSPRSPAIQELVSTLPQGRLPAPPPSKDGSKKPLSHSIHDLFPEQSNEPRDEPDE